MTDEQARIDQLEATVDELRRELADLHGARVEPEGDDAPVTRRGWLKAAAGAAAGGAIAVTGARPAAAADPNDITLGVDKDHALGRTAANYTGGLTGGAAFLFQSGSAFPPSSANFACALAGYTTRTNQPTGVYGYSQVSDGNGVVGVQTVPTGYGVRAENANGTALYAEGSNALLGRGIVATGETAADLAGEKYGMTAVGKTAAIRLDPIKFSAPPASRSDQHIIGELEPNSPSFNEMDLWMCVAGGSPGTWRKISGASTAGSLHVIEPTRVYDSRQPLPTPGILAAGQDRTISVADGRDINGGAVTAAGIVPPGATAITYNLTVTQTTGVGFLAVTPGDAATFKASTINWSSGGLDLANGGVVKLDAARQVKVFCGTGSTHFIVDITGYYL